MIKDFETYINEDYFSKLASRKDNGNARKENEITEDFVRSFIYETHQEYAHSINIRKENGKTIVDIDGDFSFRADIEEIPFQFGKVTGNFSCSCCTKLTSLKGCPQEVGGYFDCAYCENLTSLDGCPKKAGAGFNCSSCKNLTSLNGCPEYVNGDFYCYGCGKKFTKKEVKSLCNVIRNIHV